MPLPITIAASIMHFVLVVEAQTWMILEPFVCSAFLNDTKRVQEFDIFRI